MIDPESAGKPECPGRRSRASSSSAGISRSGGGGGGGGRDRPPRNRAAIPSHQHHPQFRVTEFGGGRIALSHRLVETQGRFLLDSWSRTCHQKPWDTEGGEGISRCRVAASRLMKQDAENSGEEGRIAVSPRRSTARGGRARGQRVGVCAAPHRAGGAGPRGIEKCRVGVLRCCVSISGQSAHKSSPQHRFHLGMHVELDDGYNEFMMK